MFLKEFKDLRRKRSRLAGLPDQLNYAFPIDDFTIALTDASGDYRSFSRNGDIPKVVLKDPIQAHYDLLPKYTDADIHNLTAYLVTLK